MNENKEMQAIDQESLQSVAGGNQDCTNKIDQDVQMITVSAEEKKEIDSLLYHYVMEQAYSRRDMSVRFLYGGPDYFSSAGRELRIKNLTDKLEVFARKYPNYPGLEQFVKQNK